MLHVKRIVLNVSMLISAKYVQMEKFFITTTVSANAQLDGLMLVEFARNVTVTFVKNVLPHLTFVFHALNHMFLRKINV